MALFPLQFCEFLFYPVEECKGLLENKSCVVMFILIGLQIILLLNVWVYLILPINNP